MEEESVDKGLPWSWVIEALARSDIVDIALLHELSPRLVGNSEMVAREASALRCLEGLCASGIDVNGNVIDSEFQFDPTQTCQDVLHYVWQQTDHLQIDIPDDLKWSIHSFVKHKKATFPSCTLTLLKNLILEGRLAFSEEYSGLNIPSNCNDDPVCPDRCSPSREIDDQTEVVKSPTASSGHSKSGTNGFCIDDHTQEIDSASYDLDNLSPPLKKLKLQKQDSESCDGIEDNIANQTRVGESPVRTVEQAKSSAESDHLPQTSPVKIAEQAKTSAESDHLPPMSPAKTVEQAKTSAETDDNGGCRPHLTLANMGKEILSRSNCEFNEDLIGFTETEVNLCMKCNEGGQLLSCCGETCPLLFHESCLGFFVNWDDRFNFYCPICAYSRAVSDYTKANEKVSLLRKELALFIGGGSNSQQQPKA